VNYSEAFKCSVVIPTFNRVRLLRRALDSVLNQSLQPFEVIVVDDGSNDNTRAVIAKEFPRVNYQFQENSGVSAARNKGISISSGSWIAFLDSDDEWCKHKLERQAHWSFAHPEILIVHSDEYWIRNQVRVNPKIKHFKSGGWIYPRCLPLCVISPSAVVIHRSIFSEVGLFDEQLPVCEDYDLWLRISAKFPIGYVNERLVVKYGGHDDQLSKAFEAMDQYRVIALSNILQSGALDDESRKLTIETLRKKLAILINGARKRGKLDRVNLYDAMLQRYVITNE